MTLSEYIVENITDEFCAVPLKDCRVTKARLIPERPAASHAVMLIVPYPRSDGGRIASFARIPDYHNFFASFDEDVRRLVSEKYDGASSKIFTDHSPIDERHASCRASLGVIGDNGLFISDRYGSFVFIGEIITSLSEEELLKEGVRVVSENVRECLHCGACRTSCPGGCIGGDRTLCVSAITQKKGLLSDIERDILKKSGSVWGCDVCAAVCPLNDKRSASYDPYFTEGKIDLRTEADVDALSDEEYSRYPFSWRKREVLLRNFKIIDGKE